MSLKTPKHLSRTKVTRLQGAVSRCRYWQRASAFATRLAGDSPPYIEGNSSNELIVDVL